MEVTRNVWDWDTILQFQEIHASLSPREKCDDLQVSWIAYRQWVEQGCEPPEEATKHK